MVRSKHCSSFTSRLFLMKGYEHIVYAYVLLAPTFFFVEKKFLFLYALGIFVGSLLPDIDEERSLIYRVARHNILFKIFLKPYLFFIKYIILKLLGFITGFGQHRGISHTIIFNVLLLIFNFTIIYVILKYLNIYNSISIGFYLSLGIFFGSISHIIGDSYTRSGVLPFYPKKLKIHGPFITGENSYLPILLHVIPLAMFFVLFYKLNFGLELVTLLYIVLNILILMLMLKRR